MQYSPLEPLEHQLERLRVPQFDFEHLAKEPENVTEDLVCLEQWFGKEAVALHEERMDELKAGASINVTERTHELVQQVVGESKNVPQLGAIRRACEVVAVWENERAVERAMQQVRLSQLVGTNMHPKIEHPASCGARDLRHLARGLCEHPCACSDWG